MERPADSQYMPMGDHQQDQGTWQAKRAKDRTKGKLFESQEIDHVLELKDGCALDKSEEDLEEFELLEPVKCPCFKRCLRWTKYLLLTLIALAAIAAALLYGVPILLEKVVVPLMGWEVRQLSKPVLALLSVVSLALLPSILVPTGPSMWLIGIMFGYGWGFLLIVVGCFFGMSLPYFLGHWILHQRVQAWLAHHPRNAVLLRIAEQGGWLHQFRTVVLLRMSPFPYALFNYAITATNIMYGPYITASMMALVPEAFLAIYVGRLIRTLADYHQQKQRRLTPLEMAYQGVGLSVAVLVTSLGMIYGRKALRELEMEEQAARESKELLEMVAVERRSPPLRRASSWNGVPSGFLPVKDESPSPEVGARASRTLRSWREEKRRYWEEDNGGDDDVGEMASPPSAQYMHGVVGFGGSPPRLAISLSGARGEDHVNSQVSTIGEQPGGQYLELDEDVLEGRSGRLNSGEGSSHGTGISGLVSPIGLVRRERREPTQQGFEGRPLLDAGHMPLDKGINTSRSFAPHTIRIQL